MRTGIFIGDQSIKAVKVSGKKPIPMRLPLEAGVLVDGVVKDEQKFKALLIKLVKQLGLKHDEVILSISEKHIFSKTITIKDHEENLEEKIRETIESYEAAQTQYTDWQVLEKGQDQDKVFVGLAPTQILDGYIHGFQEIGVSIAAVEPIAQAIARHLPKVLLSAPPQTQKSTQKTKKETKEAPTTKTEAPATESLGSLTIVLEDSEILLMIANNKNHIELTSVLPKETLSRREEFLLEISNMHAFYDKKMGASSIGKIFLTGEGVTEELKNKVSSQLAKPAEFLQITYPGIAPADSLAFYPVFALTDLPRTFPKDHTYLNLLPEEMLVAHERVKKIRYFEKIARFVTFSFFLLCFVYIGILGFLFVTARTVDNEIARLRENMKASGGEKVRREVLDVNKDVAVLGSFKAKKDTTVPTLSFLVDKAPPGITITHYSIDTGANTVLLSGRSLEREILIGFQAILEQEESFQHVNVPLSSLEKKGASEFSVSFEMSQ